MPTGTGVEQAAVYLRILLDRPGEYRTRWEHTPSAGIDYAAVARVLAQLDPPGATRDLTQVARRALEGASLSPEIANRFAQAFAFRPPHARRLSALMDGSANVLAVSGALLPPTGLDKLEVQPRHQTLSLHESHLLGPDGLPAEHQTIQVIRSKVDSLETLPYLFDTEEIVVEVLRGGSIGDRVHRVADSVHAVNIVLDPPLAKGHTTLLRYHSTFYYKQAPPPEFRRGFLGTANDLTMWVRFHPDRMPHQVWLARWDSLDQGDVVEQQPVELDDQLSVHCRFGEVERAVVGFHWRF